MIEEVKKTVEKVTERLRLAYKTTLDPSYAGGNPKTDDLLEGTATAEQNLVIMPYGYRLPKASDKVIILPYGKGKAIAGVEVSLHGGKRDTGGYWQFPQPFISSETTIATASRAMRVPCPIPLLVASIVFEVTTAQSSSTATVKVFSSDGTTTIINGTADTSSTGRVTITLGTAVQLETGFYIVEYSNDNAAVAVRAAALSASDPAMLNQGTAQISTTAANIAANSGTNVTQIPIIKFQC